VTAFLLSLFTSAVILNSVKAAIDNDVNTAFTPLAIIALFIFFTIPIVLTEYLFDSKNIRLFYIYYGYIVVAITALSFIFSFILENLN
jgi:hypothetical protein